MIATVGDLLEALRAEGLNLESGSPDLERKLYVADFDRPKPWHPEVLRTEADGWDVTNDQAVVVIRGMA